MSTSQMRRRIVLAWALAALGVVLAAASAANAQGVANGLGYWSNNVSTPIFGVPVEGAPGTCAGGPTYTATGALTTGFNITVTPSGQVCVNGVAVFDVTASAVTSTVPINSQITSFSGGSGNGTYATWGNGTHDHFLWRVTGSTAIVDIGKAAITNAVINARANELNFSIAGSTLAILDAGDFQSIVPFNGNADNIVTTSTDRLMLTNVTAATGGVPVQISPRSRWSGTGWDSDDSVSRTVSFFSETLPVSGATVSGIYKIGYIDPVSSAITYPLTLSSGGIATALTGFYMTSNTGMDTQSGFISFQHSGTRVAAMSGNYGGGFGGVTLADVGRLNWSSSGAVNTGGDTSLLRVAAGVFGPAAGHAVGFARAAWTNTAPSGPVACTSPTVTWSNGTSVWQIDVGTSCTGVSTLVVTLPSTTNKHGCHADNVSAPTTRQPAATAWAATTVTITNFDRTTGLAADWADGADVMVFCTAG